MKTKIAAIICLGAVVLWGASGCAFPCLPLCTGFAKPSNCLLEFVTYHLPGEEPGAHQAKLDSKACFSPAPLPSGDCPDFGTVVVDGFFASPNPECFNSDAAWHAQDADMFHDTGAPDSYADEGWMASPYRYDDYGNLVTDSSGYLLYGPNPGMALTPGTHIAAWNLMIDNNTADNVDQVDIDVYDMTTNTVLASQSITRNQFPLVYAYVPFTLNFNVTNASDQIEFRCYYEGGATITVEGCGVTVQ